jgi:hypothetical protein
MRLIRMTTLLAAAAFAVLLSACAGSDPATRVDIIDDRPQLIVANAAEDAMLIINGVTVGPAAQYNGSPNTLRLSKGTHVVEVEQKGQIVLTQKVFLSDDVIKTVTLP